MVVNFYIYANNNPVNANDPTGNCPGCVIGVIAGASAGYVSGGWQGALVGGAVGGIVGAVAPNFSAAAGSTAAGILGATASVPVIGGFAGAAGTIATNAFTNATNDPVLDDDVPLSNDLGFGVGIGVLSPLISGEAFVAGAAAYAGEAAVGGAAVANGFAVGTGVVSYIATGLDPNSTNKFNFTSPRKKTPSSTLSVSNASPKSNVSINSIIDSGLIGATNSAMEDINSIINPPAPSTPLPTGTVTVEPIQYPDAADGGFVIYPNMSNTSQIQSIYSKH